MMIGTLGFGWLLKALMLGLPILGVILILMAAAGIFQNNSMNVAPIREQPQMHRTLKKSANASTARYCGHCGAGLLADWTHCPQCGEPV
jgi:hypothetical protein